MIVDFQSAVQGTISVLGATVALPGPGLTRLAAFILAICFALSSLLFAWGFVLAFFGRSVGQGERTDFLATAHSVAVVAITSVLVATILLPGQPAFGPLVLQIGSLAASFLACQIEALVARDRRRETDDARSAGKLMAAGAAHNIMLSRIARRERPIAGGAR